MKQLITVFTLILGLFSLQLHAQDTLKNKEDGHYYFDIVYDVETNEVQNQNRTGTCWSFSALSFIESEIMRTGKGKHKLSEMFIVRKAYEAKVEQYIRMHGTINFGQGGAFHDIPNAIAKYGIVPHEVYEGLNYGSEKHNHSELAAVLKGMCNAIIKNRQGHLTTSWKAAVNGVLDAYLGKLPSEFEYKGKKYTALSFRDHLGLDMDNYLVISSYTHHPFYKPFILEVPDNWAMKACENVPLDELLKIMDNALKNGYSMAWAADVSEKGFSFKNGLAIVPLHDSLLKVKGKDNKNFSDAGADKQGSQFDYPADELKITQEMRQDAFDNYKTTDDHGMHITGMVKDQKGTYYYIVKNSWGTKNHCDGYFYASKSYVAYKTMNIMIHKKALPKGIYKKFKG